MGAKYYYYPTTSSARPRTTRRDHDREYNRSSPSRHPDHDREYKRSSPSRHPDVRPETPSLSRASTPSSSGPTTPTLRSVSPDDPKMPRRNVAFASPVAEAFRRPLGDELFVMRRFASHAQHCEPCEGAVKSQHPDGSLCDRGVGYAKELGQYFYCREGKPYSEIDKKLGRERVQVEVPGEYETVKNLFHALDGGLNLRGRPKSVRPEVHQPPKRQSPPRSADSYRKSSPPVHYSTRRFEDDVYEVQPARTDSHRQRQPVYQNRGSRFYETRTPYDDVYTSSRQTPIITNSRTPTTSRSEKYYPSRSKDDGYYGRRHEDRYYETRPRDSKRDSRHGDSPTRKRPTSTYFMPYLSSIWR